MIQTVTLTQKGQITLPKAFREALAVEPYDSVQLVLDGDSVRIEPVPDLMELSGFLSGKRDTTISSSKAREAFEQGQKPR